MSERMKSKVTSKIIKVVMIIIIFLVAAFIFIDQYAMSKPNTNVTLNLNNDGNLDTVNPISSNKSYDTTKGKEISDLLIKYERIDSADVSISYETMGPSVSIVLGINQDMDDLYTGDIIDMLISKIENLEKENIVIMDNKSNRIYP